MGEQSLCLNNWRLKRDLKFDNESQIENYSL